MRVALAALTFACLTSTAAFALTPAETLDANHAASGAWDGKTAVRTEYAYSGQGLTGKVGTTADLNDGRFVQDFVIGPLTGGNGYDGHQVWSKDNAGIVTLQEGGDAIPLAVNNAYRNANLWWRADRGGAAISGDGTKTDAGNTYDVLTIVPKGGVTFDAWFDARSHLLYRIEEKQGGVLNVTTTTNYRATDGALIAVDTVTGTGNPKFDQHSTLLSAKFLPRPDPAIYAPPASAAPDFAIAGGLHSVTIPFDFTGNHIHAKVMMNGKGPFNFVFDTGGVNLITPDLANQLGLTVEGASEVRGVGEQTAQSGMAHVDAVDVGGAKLDNQLFIVYALDSLYPSSGIHMPGMIGYETFRRFVTTVDYGAKTITLTDPKYFDPKDAGTPIRIAFNQNAVTVPGSYAGIPGKFQIDTGSGGGLALDAPFVLDNHLDAKLHSVEAVSGWGTGGPSRAQVARGDALVIGKDIVIPHPVVDFATDKAGAFADPTLAGNIGGGILKRFIVTFDYGRSVMYLKPVTSPVADLDTYDRAGVWFNLAQNGFTVIDVTKGGPAATAGLMPGDIITAVDGKPNPALPDMRYRLRNDPPGTVVSLTVMRDGKPLTFAITLRDQI
ncbi:MAG TPA: PDZ domain-containing protein [Rhizomicrobium sp.]|nr:PDZ domain-containing protein [Rhizomicrobium sp.]